MLLPSLLLAVTLAGGVGDYAVLTAEKGRVPVNLYVGILNCESGLNPKAYNPRDSDGTPSIGIAQFKSQTFARFGGKNIYDWREQLQISASMMSIGLYGHWGNCFRIALSDINEYNGQIVKK